ncbi:hypothetical protein G5714_011670 [Onychostoma macrolepis]|uniref:Uncharacterized protein n=1 Tax=Onychostoma macrolepis TaxID=369639 RepID=A0A7J6CJI7_9TELE|nr:hypothetical protein G5714_011670 [Onychostoma macrolepis]
MVLLISLIFTLFLEVQPQDERPDIRVSYDSQTGEFRILCEIPGSDNGGYTCFLSLGDEYPQFKKIQSHELSGKTLCRFTVVEYEFSRCDLETSLTGKSSTYFKSTTNLTAETSQPSQPLGVSRDTIASVWLIMVSGVIVLAGLTGICLCCFSTENLGRFEYSEVQYVQVRIKDSSANQHQDRGSS